MHMAERHQYAPEIAAAISDVVHERQRLYNTVMKGNAKEGYIDAYTSSGAPNPGVAKFLEDHRNRASSNELESIDDVEHKLDEATKKYHLDAKGQEEYLK